MFRIQDMLQPHFISCSVFSGQKGTCADPGFFVSFFSPQLILQLQRESNGFIAERTILILYQGFRGGPLFPGVEVQHFQGLGSNANFYRNPYNLLFSRGGGPDPLSPSGSVHYHSPASGECSGSVVECLTRDRRAAGSSLTGVTALWSLSKTHLS